MDLTRNHILLILNFWVFSVVVQLAFLYASPYWPQNIFAWILTIFWPVAFLAIWYWAPKLAKKKAEKGNDIRFKFVIKASLIAVPVVIIGAMIIVKIDAFIKPHFTP
ncbi:hypothetical protein [Methylophaga thiooxydans]|uniref:hypothetical protein n=1 Tax=Methylophaga thiooxydans TaxID=392484 RepID=UPI002354D456|nr:hypothetical protein [Methylophaga thiooxydans]